MGTKEYEFSVQDLNSLLVHYFDGAVPMNGQVKQILVNENMARKIALVIESDEWETDEPLFLGYDGKRTRSWSASGEETPWQELAETPKRQ